MKEDDINKKFEHLLKSGVFKPVARFITNDTEERLAEGIARTFELYRQHGLRGVELDVPVLVCACRRRATDLGRHLVKGQHRLTDALEPRAYHQGRVELHHLDGLPDEDGELDGEGDGQLEATVFDRMSANPTSMLLSTISLGEWLDLLADEDVKLLALRLQGLGLVEIATEVGMAVSTVCRRLQELGEDLAAHARLPVPKKRGRYPAAHHQHRAAA